MRNIIICLSLLCPGAHASANVIPSGIFTDNAVLQRDKPVPVWGKADPGESVSVNFAGQTVSCVADASGRWLATLPPLPATSNPGELVIQGKNTITMKNIVVGEVWLAAGQSNMGFKVHRSYDAAIEVPASVNHSGIRHFLVKQAVADVPVSNIDGKWEMASPETTGQFTAVGYYFALDLHNLLKVPVGIIHSSWGGTRVEAWLTPEASRAENGAAFRTIHERWARTMATYPAAKAKFDEILAKWQQEKAAAKADGKPFVKPQPGPPWGPGHPSTPSGLYNGMIFPLVPYALRGIIWYQGESNVAHPEEYHELFQGLITGWREAFQQGNLPFYWVQLANFNDQGTSTTNWAFLREAQTQTLALPATGQAVAIDIGDAHDIHPRNKRDVGSRLARVALAGTYGFKIVSSGPVMTKTEPSGVGFRVTFSDGTGELIAPLNTLSGFELAGDDKIFKPAQARIENNTVYVSCSEVAKPVAIRYAWANSPSAGLFNKEGLPAVPFRSDTWQPSSQPNH